MRYGVPVLYAVLARYADRMLCVGLVRSVDLVRYVDRMRCLVRFVDLVRSVDLVRVGRIRYLVRSVGRICYSGCVR